ncbi:ABC transporter permease [Brevibacillus dissolubilis]|uniref:ABC transporter permease n=1 Tax=Brevibacillus dissolubilis TaxID=1844116 RepID=UPI0011161CC7|nr:ABC transporter permease [Brevibacillus dissolubilis]
MERTDVERIHQAYLREQRRQKWLVTTTQLALLILFLGAWEWAARAGTINVLLFSYPSKIWAMFVEKISDMSLFPHIGVTLAETVIAFLLSTLLGVLIAAVIWWSPFLSRVLDPYLVVLNSMPKVALGPLFIVGLGPGLLSIIATTCAVSVIITTIVIYTSFKEVNDNYIKVIKTLGGNRWQVFTMVILPATIPAMLSSLKVNVGLSWVGVIVGEFLVAQNGLGYLIIYGFQVFNFTLVMVSLLIVAIVATLMYQGVAYLERQLTSQFK